MISGAKQIVDTLKNYGTEIVFGFIGHTTHEIAHTLSQSDIRVVNPASELGGAYMAIAFNYLRNAPAAVGIWHTVGSLLIPPALQEATSSRIPFVNLGLNADSRVAGRDALQQVPYLTFAPVSRYAARAERVDKLGELVHLAFQAAQRMPAGAAYVDIPLDLTVDRSPVAAPPALAAPRLRPGPDAEDVARTVALLQSAHKPVMVVGGGAVMSDAGDEIRALAEMIGMPVVTTSTAQGIVDETHPLSLGTSGGWGTTCANDALREADVVLVLGSRLTDWGISQGYTAAMASRLIQVDIDPARLGEFYFPELSVVADIKAFAAALMAALEGPVAAGMREASGPRLARLADEKAAWRAFIDGQGRDDQFPANPWRIMGEIRQFLGEDDIVVGDIGNHSSWVLQGVLCRKPRKTLMSFGEGVLGSAVPMGIGAKLAHPDATVVVATGDGAVQYHLNELRVAVEHDAPVIIVIFNNGQYDANEQMMRMQFGAASWTRFRNPDYVQIARAYGGDGEAIASADEIGPALQRARGSGVPYIIEVPITTDVHLVNNNATGPLFMMEGRDIPADMSGTRVVGENQVADA